MLIVGGVGLVPASAAAELPIPTAKVTIAPPTCNVAHAVVTVTDTTPLSPLVGFYLEKVTSARGLEGQPPDSITRQTSVKINTLPLAFGQTIVLTVQSLADASDGNSKWYVVASGRAVTRPTAAQCATLALVQRYIVRVYSDLFNRAPDPAGLASWTTALNRGTPRVAVANAITSSAEYRSKLITGSYDRYLGRTPDAGGLRSWLAAMGHGMTIERMESGFIASPEYFAKSGSTYAGWVRKLYADVLNRPAAPSEVTGWTTQLSRGTHRDKVAMGFLLSTEHLTTVVNGYYQDLLGRGIDPSGQRTWVGILQRGGRDEAIIGGIIASAEYYGKV